MPEHKDRRAERRARAILTNAEATLARAARSLFEGDALAALRSARVAQELLQLDRAVRRQRGQDEELRQKLRDVEHSYAAARRDLDLREAECAVREDRLETETRKLAATRASLEQLYATMYAQGGDDDPSPPGEGVA